MGLLHCSVRHHGNFLSFLVERYSSDCSHLCHFNTDSSNNSFQCKLQDNHATLSGACSFPGAGWSVLAATCLMLAKQEIAFSRPLAGREYNTYSRYWKDWLCRMLMTSFNHCIPYIWHAPTESKSWLQALEGRMRSFRSVCSVTQTCCQAQLAWQSNEHLN